MLPQQGRVGQVAHIGMAPVCGDAGKKRRVRRRVFACACGVMRPRGVRPGFGVRRSRVAGWRARRLHQMHEQRPRAAAQHRGRRFRPDHHSTIPASHARRCRRLRPASRLLPRVLPCAPGFPASRDRRPLPPLRCAKLLSSRAIPLPGPSAPPLRVGRSVLAAHLLCLAWRLYRTVLIPAGSGGSVHLAMEVAGLLSCCRDRSSVPDGRESCRKTIARFHRSW
jgi:hypothetical protein